MSAGDKVDEDGLRNDGVQLDPAASRMGIYREVRQQLMSFREPVLLDTKNPHDRLYFAALDGTGNDKIHDPDHETNVGLISDQIQTLIHAGDRRIGIGYVEGAGTQQHNPIARALDGARGYTVEARAEQMYKKFIDQASQWKQEDPDARISLASISFSRGGEEAALLARLVEERGIQDPSGAIYTYDAHHQIKNVEHTKPPLVPPHQVAQAVALLDPVGTGHARHLDRRLPPSVISGIQFSAMDEHRGLFKSDRIIDPGFSEDGRFAGVNFPGAHSDLGGGYHRNGLSIRAGNFAIDYLNGLCSEPVLAKIWEPDDPRLNVIHHSEEGMLLYRLAPKIDRMQPGGYNELLVPKRQIGQVPDAYNGDLRDETLSLQFSRQTMPNGPMPALEKQQHEAPKSELDHWIDRMYQASQNLDNKVWDRAQHGAAHEFMVSPNGQQFQLQANNLNQGWDMQQHASLAAQQCELAAQQVMQQQGAQVPQNPQGFSR